ncbi:MAG TPA: 50S ribosomal protein L25 [Candidatus Paceibacterota bacterium]
MQTLNAEKRDNGSSSALRREGRIPAVAYGRHAAAENLSVSLADFEKVYKNAGESTVITLEGLGARKDVLIHEVAHDALSGLPIHVDFYVIEKGQKVHVAVPLEFDGVSSAVKDLGGILVKVMHEIEVEAEPSALPHAIMVDLSALAALDSQIHVSDLKLPKGVSTHVSGEEVVAMISVAKEEEAAPAAMDISQIEVEKKGKKEEEGEAAAE